jgi:hypothetical protein
MEERGNGVQKCRLPLLFASRRHDQYKDDQNHKRDQRCDRCAPHEKRLTRGLTDGLIGRSNLPEELYLA